MNRAMAFGLSNKGAKVKLDIQSCALEINEATQRQLEILETTEISPKAPKVYGATIPLSMMHYGRKILYTMMETSETLHKDYVERLNLFDEIWVPTKHGANLFKSNGVTRPIMVMPLGVDIERYNSNKTPYDFGSDLNQFVFLSVFKWGYRKGYDILLKAYMDEFSAEDNVSLVLATRCETDPNPNRISEDLAYLRSGVDKQDEELPHIVLYTKHFAEKDMPRIYNSSNAFALISRGEGFGLPYYEAASCGLPIIGSKCSGHGDLLNETNSYVVEPASYAKAKVNGYMSRLAKHCRFYEDQMFPEFGDDAILKTRQHMRYVYENYSEAVKKAKVLQKIVRDNYSWDMAINRVLTRVKELN
jgi:glycosyltransferase involved in cell wall biosynthesis